MEKIWKNRTKHNRVLQKGNTLLCALKQREDNGKKQKKSHPVGRLRRMHVGNDRIICAPAGKIWNIIATADRIPASHCDGSSGLCAGYTLSSIAQNTEKGLAADGSRRFDLPVAVQYELRDYN